MYPVGEEFLKKRLKKKKILMTQQSHFWAYTLRKPELKETHVLLYARQQKSHRCKEQTFGLCGRRQAWDYLGEQH